MHYTDKSERTTLWDTAIRHLEKKRERCGVGEATSRGTVFYSLKKITDTAHAAAVLLIERSRIIRPPVAVALDAPDTAILSLACSRLGIPLVISSSHPLAASAGLIIADRESGDGIFFPEDELRALLASILSRTALPSLPACLGRTAFIFRREGFDDVIYSEAAAILAANAFSEGCSLGRTDSLVFIRSSSSPEGLFCGIIAPLLSGCPTASCGDPHELMRCLKLFSPTKLLCSPAVASALLLKLLRIKRLPTRIFRLSKHEKRASPAKALRNRLLQPRIVYTLGGRLKTVITLGEISQRRARAFFSFGLLSVMMRSEEGLSPALFRYGGDPPHSWRLPTGVSADVCNVCPGGVGSLTLDSPFVREGRALQNTYVPLQKRTDTSLVTSLSGFVLRSGNVFVVE